MGGAQKEWRARESACKQDRHCDILNKMEKKQLNFGKNSNTSPLTALFLKKRNNSGSDTKTPSAAGVNNGSNTKTDLVTSPPPNRNVQTYEGIFVDYMNISFQLKVSAYIQCMSIVDDSLYKVVCVG